MYPWRNKIMNHLDDSMVWSNDLPPIQVNFERDQAHTRFSQHNGRENVRMKPNQDTHFNERPKANLESGAITWYFYIYANQQLE